MRSCQLARTVACDDMLDSFIICIQVNFNLDACADCGDDMVGDDLKTCNCGKTVVHRFCFKLCELCG